MAMTRAQQNRKIRQDELRELLAKKGLVQKVIEDSEKIAELSNELSPEELNRLKVANDLRMKLVTKYLPDLKSTELTGDKDAPVEVNGGVSFVGVAATD